MHETLIAYMGQSNHKFKREGVVMPRSRNRLRVLVLLATALSLTALSVSAAQAEVGANWMLSGSKVTSSLLPSLTTKEVETGGLILLTTISGNAVQVSCSAVQLIGVKLETAGGLTNGGQLRFTGCLTKLNEKTTGSCEPNNGGKEPGAILTKPEKGLLVLVESKRVIRIEPKEGETLATVETSAECAIGQNIAILGKVVLKDAAINTEAKTHLFVEGSSTELWAVSKTAEHKATIDGSVVTQLAGAHAELSWSAQKIEEEEPKPIPAGVWSVNGTELTSLLQPKLKEIFENETMSTLTSILKTPVKILCKAAAISNSLGKEGAVGTVNSGKGQFSGCAVFLNGSSTASAPCLPKTAGANDIFETNSLVGTLVLIGGVTELLIKAQVAGQSLVLLESSEECAIGQKISITGELLFKDCTGQFATELMTHLMEADNIHSTLKFAGQAGTTDGSANVTLDGAHSGLKWSALTK